MSMVRKDDGPVGVPGTGNVAAVPNPPGWLSVSVNPLGGASPIGSFDFQGWQQFRQWVEMSDPGFATAIAPLK